MKDPGTEDPAMEDPAMEDPAMEDSSPEEQPRERTWTERVLDQILPEDLDWEDKVLSYPKTALIVAAGLGFALGKRHGLRLTSVAGSFAANRVANTISDVLERDSSS